MTSPPPDDLSPAAPRTLTLAEVEAGTVRAAADFPVPTERRESARRIIVGDAVERLGAVGHTMPEGLIAAARTVLDPATGDLVRVSMRRFVAGTADHREEAARLGFPVAE